MNSTNWTFTIVAIITPSPPSNVYIIVKTGPRLDDVHVWLLRERDREAGRILWIQPLDAKGKICNVRGNQLYFYPHFVSYLSIFTGAL